jgi:methylated-DNA-[protein]-cysteine S-methyltransferase
VAHVAFALVQAPWGPIHVAATSGGILAVDQLVPTGQFVESLVARGHDVEPAGDRADRAASRHAETAAAQLAEYLAGARRIFELPLEPLDRPEWDRFVLDGVRAVPWGEATSYGRVARRIGRAGAARAVGGAVGRNPIGILIPCHRVVAGDGSIGGYGGGWWGSREALLEVKRELLRLEGIPLPVGRLFD